MSIEDDNRRNKLRRGGMLIEFLMILERNPEWVIYNKWKPYL